MTSRTYSSRPAHVVAALLFATACGLTACAPDDDANTPYVPPGTPGLTQDGSAAVVADAGTGTGQLPVAPNDSGVTTPFDAGTPVVKVDSGTPVVTTDAGPVVAAEGGVAPDAGGMMRADQGMGDGKDVVTIGDSWMKLNSTQGIELSVEKASKRDYRNFGVSGTKLLDEAIPGQYASAKRGGPVKTVIMTGGGNDIIQDKLIFDLAQPCADTNFGADCKAQIDRVGDRLVKLWAEMSKDGVQDVVLVGYTTKAAPLGIATCAKSAMYSNEKIPPLCAAVPPPLRCHVLDSDVAVPSLKLQADGIHPDTPSYDAIGQAVWDLMQKQGMRR
jgi:lysophospholipase L1-like esterase